MTSESKCTGPVLSANKHAHTISHIQKINKFYVFLKLEEVTMYMHHIITKQTYQKVHKCVYSEEIIENTTDFWILWSL